MVQWFNGSMVYTGTHKVIFENSLKIVKASQNKYCKKFFIVGTFIIFCYSFTI